MKTIKVEEICRFLHQEGSKYEYHGKSDATIHDFSNLQELSDSVICWVKEKKYLSEDLVARLHELKDVLVVAPFSVAGVNCIMTDYPKGVFFSILNHFFAAPFPHTISERATVLTDDIGENVHIGPNCYVGPEVSIGDNTILHPNVVIDCPCKIGKNCEIFAGVVIGADGFGYYKDEDGVPRREIHYRGVIIGDNVEIGANSCIDRGLLTDTVIGDNTKIDNLCHVAHNVQMEENCLMTAQSGIAGSTVIEKGVYIAPGATILNQLTVGKNAWVGAGSTVIRNVKANNTVFGIPAIKL